MYAERRAETRFSDGKARFDHWTFGAGARFDTLGGMNASLAGFEPEHQLRAWSKLRSLDAPDVVVIGAGVAGTQLAARLAARDAKVALIVGNPLPERRLVDGCSLRRATLRTMADAMGISEERLREVLRASQSGFRRLRITSCKTIAPRVDGQFESGGDDLIGLSARHADIVYALRRHVPSNVALVAGEVVGYIAEQHRLRIRLPAPDGECDWPLPPRTTIANTQSRRITGTAASPLRWVAAAQQPIALPSGVLDGVGWAPAFCGAHGWQLGFVTPFWDSANPEANAYAINTMVIDDAAVQRLGRDAVLADVQEGLARCVAALGARSLDPEQTTGSALVPVVEDFTATREGGLVELYAALSSGAPAINVDGMLAQSLGIAALCRALPHDLGDEAKWVTATAEVERALTSVRRWNRFTAWNYFSAPWLLRELNRRSLSIVGRRVVRDWAELGLT